MLRPKEKFYSMASVISGRPDRFSDRPPAADYPGLQSLRAFVGFDPLQGPVAELDGAHDERKDMAASTLTAIRPRPDGPRCR